MTKKINSKYSGKSRLLRTMESRRDVIVPLRENSEDDEGVGRVWTEFLQQKKIIELNRKDYYSGRGMSWGKYVM